MKELKIKKKKNFIRKLFVKLCRIFGYEIIDQSDFEISTTNKSLNSNLSILGKKSINIPLGEVKVTRSVKSLDIIIRTCMKVNMLQQNKKRIFEKKKSEYTFRSLQSLYKSALDLKKKFPKIFIQFTIIDIGSEEVSKNKLISFVKDFPLKFIDLDKKKINIEPVTINKNNEIIERNMAKTMKSIYESFDQGQKCKDLVYFVEDDYIHKTESLAEMVFAYEKFSSIFERELFMLSTDYPYLYKKMENSKILVGEKYHWRTVKESLLTFLTSNQMLAKYEKKLFDMAKNESNPFEKNLHEIFDKELCFSPIPSLSVHCSNINSAFGISPNIDIHKPVSYTHLTLPTKA